MYDNDIASRKYLTGGQSKSFRFKLMVVLNIKVGQGVNRTRLQILFISLPRNVKILISHQIVVKNMYELSCLHNFQM